LRVGYRYDIVTYDGNRAIFTATKRMKDFKEFGTIYPNLKKDAKKN